MSRTHQLISKSCRAFSTKSPRIQILTSGRSFSSVNSNPPSSSSSSLSSPQTTDERTLLTHLSPLKRIVCLCPVSLGRGRVSWSGGDSPYPHEDETIDLNFQSQPNFNNSTRDINITQMQPFKVAKYRYGERFAIGVAVSDPYLTSATPVSFDGDDGDGGNGNGEDVQKRRFVAEIVPTFRCDAHNLGSSPIFHTNLPFFRNDFLQHIGHLDIGAIVLAMPMRPNTNPFCPMPTKVQLEQERKLTEVRESILNVLQNYVVSVEGEGGEDATMIAEDGSKRQPGPLNLQACIDHRLSITDVLSKTNNDGYHGNWDHISKSIRQIQNNDTVGRSTGGKKYFGGNGEHGGGYNDNVFSVVPPEIHAAVALNAMMDEKYSSGYQNRFF